MQQQNSTTPAATQWPQRCNFVQNRTAAEVLHDLWIARRKLKQLFIHAQNVILVRDEMEAEYAATQASADDDGNKEALQDLAITGAQYIELCKQGAIVEQEIIDTQNTVTMLTTEAATHGGIKL